MRQTNFYNGLQADILGADARLIHRQALAGMLWSKQFYYFDIPEWLHGDPLQPRPPERRKEGRNAEWVHLNNADIVSMPDRAKANCGSALSGSDAVARVENHDRIGGRHYSPPGLYNRLDRLSFS